MDVSPRSLGIQVAVWLALVVVANLVIAERTTNALPRQLVRRIEQSPAITDLFVGHSQMVADIDAETYERTRPDTHVLNLGLGATSPIEHDLLLRRGLKTHPTRVYYGFFDAGLTNAPPVAWRDLMGNRAMVYYVDRETAISFIAPHNPWRAWQIRLTSLVPMLVERATLWAKVEQLRRALAGVGQPSALTNQFGRVDDFARLEPEDDLFRRQCREPVDRHSDLVPPVADMLDRGHATGARVVMIEMPVPRAHRQRFYSTAEWQRYLAYVVPNIERRGGIYLDASDWLDDHAFNDAVHLTADGARTFSGRLAAWSVTQGL